MTAIANARQSVAAPVRKSRRYGLLSVADVVDGGEAHWIMGGLTADGEECSMPQTGTIECVPTATKTPRSWYSDIEAEPWLTYMYETCKTVGRYSESQAKLRQRFLASEQSAVEKGFQASVLSAASSIGSFTTISRAIAELEFAAADVYGGQPILHLPFQAAEEASRQGVLRVVGDHLETVAGSLVSVGRYDAGIFGTPSAVFATGGVVLYRSDLIESGPAVDMGNMENDYYVLIERAYAALIDCFVGVAQGALCECGVASGGGGPV